MTARMSSADLVQRKGFGLALWASMKARTSASSWAVERWTPRRICFSVRHEVDVEARGHGGLDLVEEPAELA